MLEVALQVAKQEIRTQKTSDPQHGRFIDVRSSELAEQVEASHPI